MLIQSIEILSINHIGQGLNQSSLTYTLAQIQMIAQAAVGVACWINQFEKGRFLISFESSRVERSLSNYFMVNWVSV